MKIGFIGFGQVNRKLAELLSDETLLTSIENRSSKTIDNINEANITILDTFKEVAENSDILISATSPKQSLEISKKYGKYCKGIYLDLNNISPKTTDEVSGYVDNFVDGAIIGGINNNFVLYLSGNKSHDLLFLDNYLPIKIVSNNIGDASKLKLLRSIYTKSLSAILIETTSIAESLNLKEELLDTIAISEGENFIKSSLSRIKNTKNNSKRKKEEMLEILEYFEDYDLEMSKAALEKLSNI